MKIIGIDPGINGGIAFFSNTKIIHATIFPHKKIIVNKKTKKEIDLYETAKMIKIFKPDTVFIEKVGAMPKQGVTSTFRFGFFTGALHGIISCLNVEIETVRPQEWKSVILEDTDKDKEAAIKFCETNYPNISLYPTKRTKNPHDGIADAICIAVYGLSQKININNHNEKNDENSDI